MSNVQELRARPSETEKITVNLGYVDLGHVDLMVQEGFYSNRTDFIRTAIRNQLERHADVVKKTVARKTIDLGLRHYSREDLEAVEAARQSLHLRVLGLVTIAPDVSAELARATIASISVLGALHDSAGSRTPWRTVCSSRRTSTKKSSCSKLGARPAPTLEQYSNEGESP